MDRQLISPLAPGRGAAVTGAEQVLRAGYGIGIASRAPGSARSVIWRVTARRLGSTCAGPLSPWARPRAGVPMDLTRRLSRKPWRCGCMGLWHALGSQREGVINYMQEHQ